jgi:hypothetical protein
VLPEVEKLRGLPMLWVQGSDEGNWLGSSLPPALVRFESRRGGTGFREARDPRL